MSGLHVCQVWSSSATLWPTWINTAPVSAGTAVTLNNTMNNKVWLKMNEAHSPITSLSIIMSYLQELASQMGGESDCASPRLLARTSTSCLERLLEATL